ncbi:MAG: hypothetical protein R3D27_03790 [Hyphomicrobiaceae bacterium]
MSANVNGNELLSEREEIEALLPWYVVGTLTEGEARRVEKYIARHPDMERQLGLVREEMAETAAANEALPSAPAGALGRLMEQVRAQPQSAGATAARGLWTGLASLFSAPTASAVRWATVAAATVILAQAVAIGLIVGNEPSAGYETASGRSAAPAAVKGTRLLVQFKPAAGAGVIAEMLAGLGAEIVGGPKPGGAFIIRISEKPLAENEKNAIITRLRARGDLVGLVLPTE